MIAEKGRFCSSIQFFSTGRNDGAPLSSRGSTEATFAGSLDVLVVAVQQEKYDHQDDDRHSNGNPQYRLLNRTLRMINGYKHMCMHRNVYANSSQY